MSSAGVRCQQHRSCGNPSSGVAVPVRAGKDPKVLRAEASKAHHTENRRQIQPPEASVNIPALRTWPVLGGEFPDAPQISHYYTEVYRGKSRRHFIFSLSLRWGASSLGRQWVPYEEQSKHQQMSTGGWVGRWPGTGFLMQTPQIPTEYCALLDFSELKWRSMFDFFF